MMHNSLLIRDILRRTNKDPLHRERRDPHRLIGPHQTARCSERDFQLQGQWTVVHDDDIPGMSELSDDLTDFLSKMGVQLSDSSHRKIRLNISDIPVGTFRLSMAPEKIRISAADIRGLWAGAIYLEREMGIRRGPFLPTGDISKHPSWKVQISQSPWGSNYLVPDLSPEYLSDDAFRLLAHYGVNGMTIYGDWLCYVRSGILPELNYPDYEVNIRVLRDATERAARYGISFYYVPVGPKLRADHPTFLRRPNTRGALHSASNEDNRIHCLCSSDPDSLAFHAEVMENVFREVPKLGGLILIIGGESYYHCYMRPAQGDSKSDIWETNCPVCARRPAEQVVADFVRNTAEAVKRAKPEAWVLAWPYSAMWSSDPDQLGFIAEMPSEAGLLSEIDKGQLLRKNGYTKSIWDYSVDFTGPSDRIVKQAEGTRRNGLSLFIKTETAMGLEMIHAPYIPCLDRLAEKWRNVYRLNPDGVLQSWMFFGMWGSRAEELGWWTSWHPGVPSHEALKLIADRDFGGAAEAVLAAWERMSDAISHLPCIPEYFNGPSFLGPAHPLIPERGQTIGPMFHALFYYLQEGEESFSRARLDISNSLVMDELPESPRVWGFHCDDRESEWEIFTGEIEGAVRESESAFRMLTDAENLSLDAADRARLHEERVMVEFIYRTLATAIHTLKFLRLRDSAKDRVDGRHLMGMKEIAEAELANALSARHIYEEAPWLDISFRTDGGFPSSKAMLGEKIDLLKGYLSSFD